MEPRPNRARVWIVTAAAAAGVALGAAGVANAATSSSTPSTSSSSAPSASSAPAAPNGQSPAQMDHGPGETLLTGTTAEKVTAAAKAAVPGATVIRVETDSGGATYEAHVQKSDGSYVTVLLDGNFKVTGTDNGFGPGPAGAPGGPGGQDAPGA